MSQARFLHYTPPNTQPSPQVTTTTIAPQDTTNKRSQPHVQVQQQQPPPPPPQQSQPPPQPQPAPTTTASGPSTTSSGTTNGPIVATGDWAKDLVHLAKTAELKKHALTLQLHTAHILSAHAILDQKNKAIQDVREQKNKLDSERTRLINALREINEDRDKVDLMEASLTKECNDIRQKIANITEGEYSVVKRDVDRLRDELGQPSVPPLQAILDEKSSQYLNDRRLNGNGNDNVPSAPTMTTVTNHAKRSSTEMATLDTPPAKRPRGRPKGSKNKGKEAASASAAVAA
ncbi:hypothetical protein ONZ45_g14719 [Pleurotus djamor]|nr:hypothetical protein ONZ45_g14719 [Pleurotus djamor]